MDTLIKKYLWIFNLIGILFCSYFLAKITNVFVADQLMVDRSFSLPPINLPPIAQRTIPGADTYKIILDRNVFDSKEVAAPMSLPTETQTAIVDPNAPPVKTTLPIRLVATFSVGNGESSRSTATIQNGSSLEVYSIGGEKLFSPGVQIKKILPDRVEFLNSGRMEYVEIEKMVSSGGLSSVGAPKPGDPKTTVSSQGQNKFVIDQAEIDNALSNLNTLLTQVNFAPATGPNGKSMGIKVQSVAPVSLFAKLGMRRGDIIERINGTDMDMQKSLEILPQLKGEKHITIDLTRNGQKQTLDYEIR